MHVAHHARRKQSDSSATIPRVTLICLGLIVVALNGTHSIAQDSPVAPLHENRSATIPKQGRVFRVNDSNQTAQRLIEGMRNVGQAWAHLAASGEVFVQKCANNTYAAQKLQQDTKINIDVQKTNSEMNPYIGIAYISGMSLTNARSPHANGFLYEDYSERHILCFKTAEDALANIKNSDFIIDDLSRELDFKAYYILEGGRITLVDGNTVFQNGFLRRFQGAFIKPDSGWRSVISLDVR
ncbi:hypothetical protein AMC83_CH04149 [Rhizobium phaseoli]|uniref:hypothetical protein n=1 Tax=Rhizobium phaseoli TaxID=396 RepID=UPI0007E9A3F9|nr:hypothetical protein [Rhizobium phaseoli]ANL74066.1 hypothetical protein AMC83_CH04149 [Rhizobium phaseoli]